MAHKLYIFRREDTNVFTLILTQKSLTEIAYKVPYSAKLFSITKVEIMKTGHLEASMLKYDTEITLC